MIPTGRVRALPLALLLLAPALSRAQESPRVADERVVLHTNAGDIVLALYPDVAPKHVEQVLRLARLGDYDSTRFVRVIPGFMVQLADAADRAVPLNDAQAAALRPLRAEFSSLHHRRGVLSMSRDPSDPDSASSAFSILLGDWPQGDGRCTIFGRVEAGMDVVDEFLKVPRDDEDRPTARLEVLSAEVLTAAELAGRPLAGARPVASAGSGPAEPERELDAARARALVAALAVMTLLVLAAYAASLLRPKAAPTLNLINALVGAFFLAAAVTPSAYRGRVVSVALFLGILAAFKIMSGAGATPDQKA